MRGPLGWIGLLAAVAGLILAAFSPGGWFNTTARQSAELHTPVGSVGVSADVPQSSNWPRVGYALLIGGGVLLVASAVARRAGR